MITRKYISDRYDQILAELQVLYPLHQWKHQPTGLTYTTKKAIYGEAHRDGTIVINETFLLTNAITRLENTLRHEFTHLAIGIAQHHNKVFKAMERHFGVDHHHRDLNRDIAEYDSKVDYKYTLIAHLKNGSQRSLGGYHRKTKRFTSYNQDSLRGLFLDKIKILRFEYRERN